MTRQNTLHFESESDFNLVYCLGVVSCFAAPVRCQLSKANAEFVCAMADVLEVYHGEYKDRFALNFKCIKFFPLC